jgi:SPP1 family predicted phage head-tail adaptor
MAKATQIGDRRHRIAIEKPVTSRGTSGQELMTWETHCNVWAKATWRSSGNKDDMMADRLTVQTAVTFDIMYRDGLNEKMRINFEGDLYDILYFQKPDFRQSLIIVAQKQD